MNVYQMYVANGNRADFFVQRDKWSDTIARVVSVGGLTTGPLDGSPPYFRAQKVHARFYNKTTGDLQNEGDLSCPGTFAYRLIGTSDLPTPILKEVMAEMSE